MKPFDKVLVRSAEYGLWMPALYGKEKDGLYITSAGWQTYCIPYEGNEHLLNTNKPYTPPQPKTFSVAWSTLNGQHRVE